MQTPEVAEKPAMIMEPTSSTEHYSGELELDRHQLLAVVKRKRTKRPRHHPPASSLASSSESTTTEEEDMAHCLILLAQGGAVDSKPSPAPQQPPAVPTVQLPSPPVPAVVKSERYTSRKYTEAATTADGLRAGFYVYECKTCNKCFPTFQALGGHRASHKKPRLAAAAAYEEDIVANAINITTTAMKHKPPTATASPPRQQADIAAVFPDVTTALSLNNNVAAASSSKLRVHECSICGAEFASGQALGGHMRRHRPLNAPPVTTTAITAPPDTRREGSTSINLELDLNLPAPSDEEAVSLPPPPVVLGLGQFNDGKKAGLMLTASALVDCHY